MGSAEFRRFLAQLAIDPADYGRFLADPLAVARDAGLSEAQLDALDSGDQNRWYAALTDNSTDHGNRRER